MSTRSKTTKLTPAAGVKVSLTERAQQRRETQRALVDIHSHLPMRRNDTSPDLTIVRRAIESLKPASRRVRQSEQAQGARLDASIRRFGIVQPILATIDGTIVHGHGMWEAARRAGIAEMPVIIISHLTPGELRALTIALNRLGETGRWDEAALRLEVQELIDLGEDVVVTGFEPAEIDGLLLEDEAQVEASDEEGFPALGSVAVSRSGDLWRLGPHLLLQGDARDAGSYERMLPAGERARLVLTDEPFNVPNQGHVSGGDHREFAMAHGEMSRDEFAAFNTAWMTGCAAHLMDGGLLATFIDWRSVELVLACGRELGLDLINLIVWSKSNGGQGSLWRSQHELLPVFKVGSAPHVNNVRLGRHGRWRSNVWTYAGASSLGSDARAGLGDHPTVKPRKLLEDALLDVSHRGEIVLDPFLGSGSTLLAAHTTGRICRAIEIDGQYCDLAIQRWETLTGAQAVLDGTGETSAAVKRRRAAEAAAPSSGSQAAGG